MKKFTETIFESNKEYTLISAVAGENPETTYASLKEIKDPKWLTNFFFGGEMGYEYTVNEMISLIDGQDFKHNGHLVFSGDAGHMIIVKNDKIIDIGYL